MAAKGGAGRPPPAPSPQPMRRRRELGRGRGAFSRRTSHRRPKVRRDEAAQIAVEPGGGVGGLVARAVVLDHLVGVEDVAADLVAPARLDVLALEGGLLRRPALQLALQQARLQDAQRRLLVARLGALVLAGDDDAGGGGGGAR